MKPYLKTFSACLIGLLVGVVCALLSITPAGLYVEEEYGLTWLFKLRGAKAAPEEVIIVSIDKQSAEQLKLSDNPEKWQRSYYAGLIEQLSRQKPAIIALNVYFSENRSFENDAMLAKTITQNGNTILSNYLKQSGPSSITNGNGISYEMMIDPAPLLNEAAMATAPFPLPKTSSTIKQCWTFKNSAGDIPTLPITIFQYYVLKSIYPEILQLLDRIDPKLLTHLPSNFEQLKGHDKSPEKIQEAFLSNIKSAEEFQQLLAAVHFTSEKKRLLLAWLSFLQNSDNFMYLNHYGKAGTITTIPFHQALTMTGLDADTFSKKIILVGYSETIEPEKNQGLYNIFSADGETISPIEIAATAVGNLISDTWLKPLPLHQQCFLLLAWSFLLAAICRTLPYPFAVSLLIFFTLVYLAISYHLFTARAIWIPVFIPAVLQMPIMLMTASLFRFAQTRREHQKIQKAFHYYLPEQVVSQIANQPGINEMSQYGEIMHGVCLATDAGQYTTLSEALHPSDLNVLMNRYYNVIFAQVKNHDGMISDVIGDAMMSLWTQSRPEVHARSEACHAALDIKAALDRFNQDQPYQIPTRLGLHYGEMRLGNVGAAHHYEYRAIGDTVNTASRIEGLNKPLATQILVSSSVIDGLPDFFTRETGIFILPGKTIPIRVFELLGLIAQAQPHQLQLALAFASALEHFQNNQWPEALQLFIDIQNQYPDDGPTRFYVDYLTHTPYLPKPGNTTAPYAIAIKKSH